MSESASDSDSDREIMLEMIKRQKEEDTQLEMIKLNKEYRRECARMKKSELALTLSETLFDVYLKLECFSQIGKHILRLISEVIKISQYFKSVLVARNGNKNKFKPKEAVKIEIIAGLSDRLKEDVESLIELRELENEGREKVLKTIKPLLWLTWLTDLKLHVDLMDYEKRRGKPFSKRPILISRDPYELLPLYSERCFATLMRFRGHLFEDEFTKLEPT